MRLLADFPRCWWLKRGRAIEDSIRKEATVVRLYRGRGSIEGRMARIYVDAIVPPDDRIRIDERDPRWMPDGSFRTTVLVRQNAKTLAPFLESGLSEMDVRETES